MSYKNTLQEHNILIQQAIDKAIALPDAGGDAPTEDLAAEIEAQAALIEAQAGQIEELLTVLDGKAAGGGGGITVETCNVTNGDTIDLVLWYTDADGNFVKSQQVPPGDTVIVRKNTFLFVLDTNPWGLSVEENDKYILIPEDKVTTVYFIKDDCSIRIV